MNRREGVSLAGHTSPSSYICSCFQGSMHACRIFFSGGGGDSWMTYFVRVCICAAAMRMLVKFNNYVNSGSE